MDGIDLLKVVKLLDNIITSERKEVRDAFRELMVISALCEDKEGVVGPLSTLIRDVEQLQHQVNMLQHEIRRESIREDQYRKYYTDKTTGNPHWNDIMWGGVTQPQIGTSYTTGTKIADPERFNLSNHSLADLQTKYSGFFPPTKEEEE